MTLLRVTAPAETPITLAEAKAHLRVDGSAEDPQIQSLIDTAVALIDGDGSLGRAMVTQTWSKWVSQTPGVVRIGMGPFIGLTAVDYYDADNVLQSATLADFEVRLDGDFVNIRPKSGKVWPNAYIRDDSIKLTFTAGYGAAADVPENLKSAIKLLIGIWFGPGRDGVSEKKLTDVPFGIDALIGKERVSWYG